MVKFIISLFMSLNFFGYHPFQSEHAQVNQSKEAHVAEQSNQTLQTVHQISENQNNSILQTEPKLQFAVISDTHISTISWNGTKLKAALKDLKKVAPHYEVLAVNGDLTDNGLPEEYDLFNTILHANLNQNASKFLVIGNHEWREKKPGSVSTVTDQHLIKRFLIKENVPGLYYDQWIKGYHFIAMAGEKSAATLIAANYSKKEADGAYLSDRQLRWLEQTLADGAENGKPIFVFLHQPIKGTVYGSEWGTVFQAQKLLALLKKYPQVILFTGHSHYPLIDPRSIIQDGITMVNTSSVAYTYTPETGADDYKSQGLVVNVYDHKIELKEREFNTGSWIRTVTIPIKASN
ncbi:metallophosphoesterase [Bacillus sp. BRMEA1]|uniref:metallophosphoesterase family protein n=1 Tax=Neobacillus endophyticus TaxID=2738405 RepID=UPI001567862B|nr:metallophosphoesterase [Neobacillus endophyticus]NRD79651.1 metallophosphoesterase [Neobacillus endophyticus]